jgi:transcriptional regulator with XRE-family HTH domain
MNERKINQFICHQLVKAREDNGLTQKKVEENGILKQSNLSKIENGAKKISAAKLFILADFYQKPIEYFFQK